MLNGSGGRTVKITMDSGVDAVGIIGQQFDTTAERVAAPLVGAQVLPASKPPLVYASTDPNVASAIDERLTRKANPCKWTKADFKKVMDFSRKAVNEVFTKQRVNQWIIKNLDMSAIKSGKWSEERLRKSLDNLWQIPDPEFQFTTACKAEVMPDGKAPRFLIADGDAGQLMALLAISCFESILFEEYEEHSIKHEGKRQAVQNVAGRMKAPGTAPACMIEGDGSAWDATCNTDVRESENFVIAHITKVLHDNGVVPNAWLDAHVKANSKKSLKLMFRGKFNYVTKHLIPAIRRSGHRGTSCLNWWTNFMMWSCSVYRDPGQFLKSSRRNGIDVTGKMRWMFGAYEGDDSLVCTSPRLEEDAADTRQIKDFWVRAGFNMKFVHQEKRATFVGYHVQVENGRATGLVCPELPRAFTKSASCSADAKIALRAGSSGMLKKTAAALAVGKAADFAGILPTVSQKYLDYAESLTSDNFHDREMSIRAGMEGKSKQDIVSYIKELNGAVDPHIEKGRLFAMQYTCTDEELLLFTTYAWDIATVDDYAGFAGSLPAAWR